MSEPGTNPLSYNDYISAVCALAVEDTTTVSGVVQSVNAAFNTLTPSMLNYAELRIQRDVDLLPLLTSNSYTMTALSNLLQIPVGDFVTIQTIAVISGGMTYPLMAVTKEWLQNTYGDSSTATLPSYFAMYGGDQATGGQTWTNIIVGPFPSQNFAVSVTGTQRMPSLYQSANPTGAATGTTFISTWLPDLLVMASLVFVAQYQRQFGATGNDPQMPGSYESQYQTLLRSAAVEEARKKFSASAWSSMPPIPAASPTR